jgi:hypothetical protein
MLNAAVAQLKAPTAKLEVAVFEGFKFVTTDTVACAYRRLYHSVPHLIICAVTEVKVRPCNTSLFGN